MIENSAVLLFVMIGGVAIAAFWLIWHLIARPLAVAFGMIPMAAEDYVVSGWKAERQGRWADALRAYKQARSLSRPGSEGHLRYDALLEAHPELLNAAK